uniref:Putative reverse transcriptase, RNA-dependent DNA polymerase, Gag-polypeptide of LTR copia-type n=1 Tax=Tanacetum cinerariifolium TaxID=118510 RepID=A0A699ID42_TANCI|nr:putative reverse transcriptase, RNA-dependent DNA polymerase, Gag-polypeptide of LTR copia-type [Tanacetum cinerariifolium]
MSFDNDGTELDLSFSKEIDFVATSMEEETHLEGTGSLTRNHEEMVSGSETDSNSNTYSTSIIGDNVKYGVERVVNYSNLTSESFCFVSALNKSIEPRTYKEAILDDNWVNAMNKEIKALNKNHTWDITELPPGRKPIGCKWIYNIKYKANGEIERYKAMLVAKGFNQREGFGNTGNKNLVCKLNKSFYGLKQAPRKSNEKLVGILRENGFVQSCSDHSLFTKTVNNIFVAFLVYVDDIVITGNDENKINKFKQFLSSKYQIKDLGLLKYFLGIEVIKQGDDIYLSQRKYCLELLHDFGLLSCKPVSIPMEANTVLPFKPSHDNPYLDNITGYQKLICKLIYLTHTRPDISYFVHCLSQHMHSPLKSHLQSALNVLRYLKGSPEKGLKFSHNMLSNMFEGYADSDWAKCPKTRKSVLGYCVFYNENLISWKSKKQATLSKSSTKAEYRSLGSAACEIIWILKIMKDLKVEVNLPVSLLCDNKAVLQLVVNHVFQESSKHFKINVHFIREKNSKGIISAKKIGTLKQTADILTKHLGVSQHNQMINKLGLFNLFTPQIMGGC